MFLTEACRQLYIPYGAISGGCPAQLPFGGLRALVPGIPQLIVECPPEVARLKFSLELEYHVLC